MIEFEVVNEDGEETVGAFYAEDVIYIERAAPDVTGWVDDMTLVHLSDGIVVPVLHTFSDVFNRLREELSKPNI